MQETKITTKAMPTHGGNVTLPTLTCLRCGHVWVLRRTKLPRVCSKCKSPYWSKLRGWAKNAPRGVFNRPERKRKAPP